MNDYRVMLNSFRDGGKKRNPAGFGASRVSEKRKIDVCSKATCLPPLQGQRAPGSAVQSSCLEADTKSLSDATRRAYALAVLCSDEFS